MSDIYTLPTPKDPDNDKIKIDVIIPGSPSSFINFKHPNFTFNPKKEDSNHQYIIKI